MSFGTKFTKNEYLYSENQPGAPVKVGDADYKYDASGNPVSMRGGDSDRTLKYDAENRLKVIEDTQNGTMSLYTYNHTGERSLKRYGAFNTAYVNGAYAGSGLDGLTRYSAYVSPDHLGSTTHITDKGGNVVQYAAYTPYGTLFREYKSVMPYKFNGKELDAETGLYYYGARYYDPTTALWLGLDPLAEKYPDVSPYVYCAGNPVKLIDPDGQNQRQRKPQGCL